MARELLVVWTGKRRRGDPWQTLCDDYRERVARFLPARDVVLRLQPGDGAERLGVEAAAVRAALPQPCRRVVLDRRGRALSSRDLAAWLERTLAEWPHATAFVIGSDLGIDPALAREADLALSLGPLTLPHALARLTLWEQLYRCLSLASGMKYHRDPL
jgi:23S rRNA (pseudouridine1915-N3)-methyltransferase